MFLNKNLFRGIIFLTKLLDRFIFSSVQKLLNLKIFNEITSTTYFVIIKLKKLKLLFVIKFQLKIKYLFFKLFEFLRLIILFFNEVEFSSYLINK